MSYNVDHAEYVSGELSIKCSEVIRLLDEMEGELPEVNFLEELQKKALKALIAAENPSLPIKRFDWYGEGSGHGYRELLPDILKCTEGEAEVFFVWEGGDSFSGLHICNGVMTEKKVKFTLE